MARTNDGDQSWAALRRAWVEAVARQRTASWLAAGLQVARQELEMVPRPALAAAAEVSAARRLLAASLGQLRACATCVITERSRRRVSGRHGRRPAPSPIAWAGGRCCEARTDQLFDEVELLLLAIDGVALADLRPASPSTPPNDTGDGRRGCAFRQVQGCALGAPLRPTVCVGYICRELAAELEQRGALRRIACQVARMEDLRQRFVELAGPSVHARSPISGLAEL